MAIPNDFVQANTAMLAIYSALHAQLVANDEQESADQLTAIMAGVIPPERVSEFFEFGYAKADLLDTATKAAFADVGAFATANSFYGLGQDGRGVAMGKVLRGQSLPNGVTPPVPSSKYAPPAPAPVIPPVPEGNAP